MAATCATGAVLAAAAGVSLHLGASGVAQRQWRKEISQASIDEIPALMGHLAEQDDVGLPVLVELLDDDHPDVALAAGRALRNQMHAWRGLPIDASSRKVAALAALLAGCSDAFRSPARYAAAQLAGEIVDWPLDEHAVDIAAVLAHCETIFRAAPARPDELMRVAHRGSGESPPSPTIALPITTSASTQPNPSPLGIVGEMPGGGLAVEPRNNAPPPLNVLKVLALPTEEVQQTRPNPSPPGEIYAPLAIPLELTTQPPSDRHGLGLSRPNTPSSIQPRDTADPSALSDVELMRALQDVHRRRQAEGELRRRGFDALRLEVARRLTDPDPNIRKELAGVLPRIAGVDARPWLEELAADPHPDVRRVAIAILATGGGEGVDKWLREIRHDESDPHVAELIDGILDKRR